MPRGTGAHPDELLTEQRALEQDACDPGHRERRDGARLEPGRGDDLVGAGDARVAGTRGRRDLRRDPPAGHREMRAAVARRRRRRRLHDLLELAADDACSVTRAVCPSGNSSRRDMDAPLAQNGCNSLDRLGPRLHQRNRRARLLRCPNRNSRKGRRMDDHVDGLEPKPSFAMSTNSSRRAPSASRPRARSSSASAQTRTARTGSR